MMNFISENLATILIATGLAVVVALIIFKIVKDKKKGKSSYGCGCEGCPSSNICHKK